MLSVYQNERLQGFAAEVSPDIIFAKTRQAGSAAPDIADLERRRMVFISEANENDKYNEANLRKLTGDDFVAYRGLYGKNQKALKNTAKIYTLFNHDIKPSGALEAYYRRLVFIPFGADFVDNPIPNTNQRQRRNNLHEVKEPWFKSAFFKLLVDGCVQWFKDEQGLMIPECIKDLVKAKKEACNIFQEFVDLCLVVKKIDPVKVEKEEGYVNKMIDKKYCIVNKQMMEYWKFWCDENGHVDSHGKAPGDKKFGQEMAKLGMNNSETVFNKYPKKFPRKPVRWYYATKLTDEFYTAYYDDTSPIPDSYSDKFWTE